MSDDAATGLLAVVAAFSAAFGAAWPFFLAKILDATHDQPNPAATPLALGDRRRTLRNLALPAALYVAVTGFVMAGMLLAAALIVRDLVGGTGVGWPQATLLGAAALWLVGGTWLLTRLRRVAVYRDMIDRWLRDAASDAPPHSDDNGTIL